MARAEKQWVNIKQTWPLFTSTTSMHQSSQIHRTQCSLYFPPVFTFVLLHTPVKMTDTNIYISLPDLHCSVLRCSLGPLDSVRLYLLSLLRERHTHTQMHQRIYSIGPESQANEVTVMKKREIRRGRGTYGPHLHLTTWKSTAKL